MFTAVWKPGNNYHRDDLNDGIINKNGLMLMGQGFPLCCAQTIREAGIL
ncbi:MAG TPA: hypothetical protein VKR53_02655 [Puia sp.]|nr:hypothetical protein [Puia sp.]